MINNLVATATQAAPATAQPAPSQEVLNAYQTLFGREADMPGALGWTQSGLTGQALLNAMAAGAQGADIQAFENYQKGQIQQNYLDLFGREAEEEGLNQWLTGTNLIGDELTNALKAGARGADIGALYKTGDTDISGEITAQSIKDYMTQNVNDPYAIYSAAEKYRVNPETISAVMGYSPEEATKFTDQYGLANLISQEYGDIGRGFTGDNIIDQPGFNYWFSQLQSGAISPDQFEKAFLTGAMDTVQKGYDPTVSSRTIAESIAKGYGGVELIDKANPLDVYEAVRREGQTVESLAKLYPTLNPQQITDYLARVPDAYAQNIDQTITDILGADYASKLDPTQKQNLVDQLVAGELDRSKLTDMFANSNANKQQEALRIANAYVTMYGGTKDDAAALYAKLLGVDYTGPGKVDSSVLNQVKSIFDTSLTDQEAGVEELIRKAAAREGAENTEFFKANPSALAVYRDVGETVAFPNGGSGGQYGYLNGKPILKASEVDQLFNEMGTDYIRGDAAGQLDNDIGWDPGSLSAVTARGAAAFGIQKQPIMSAGDSEFSTPTGEYTYTGDMNAIAQQFGIDPTKYTSQDDLYDAINAKAQDFVFIAGKSGYQAGGIGEQVDGKTQTPGFADATANHAAQMYQRVGDKYIPVGDTKYFNAGMELSPGSWFSDTFGGIASIPFIAELSLLNPTTAAFYPAIKGAQTAALGGDFGDILKSAGMSYAAQNLLPKVAGNISRELGSAGISNPIINQALTQGVIGGGISTLAGGSGTEGLTSGLISGGIGGALNATNQGVNKFIVQDLGVPQEYVGIFANTLASLAPTLLTGGKIDPTKVLMNYMLNQAFKKPTFDIEDTPFMDTKQTTAGQGVQSIMTSEGRDLGISPKEWERLSPEEQQGYMLEDSQFSKYIKRLMGEGTISYDDGMNLLGSGYRGEGIMRTPTETLDITNYSNWYELLKGFGMTDPDAVASQPGLESLRQRENTRDINI